MEQYELATPEKNISSGDKRRHGFGFSIFILLVITLVVGYWMLSPGVFTIQPIGALPDGVTIIYHSRNAEMPFFSSPDGLCLKIQGSVNLLCRAMAMSSATDLADRVLIKLPYSRWAYLQSTDGREFDR